jgi:hypothetical protein
MNTAREALFKAMLQHGWFTASGGSDESPLGIFGYVINTQPELKELYEAFEDVIKAYGKPNDGDATGDAEHRQGTQRVQNRIAVNSRIARKAAGGSNARKAEAKRMTPIKPSWYDVRMLRLQLFLASIDEDIEDDCYDPEPYNRQEME